MANDVTPQSVDPSILHRIFRGKQGIRAGWSIGIFLVLMALLSAALFLPAKYILETANLPITDEEPLQACVGEFVGFLGLLGASITMAFIEHKPFVSYGLEGRRRSIGFVYGALSGFIALSVLVLALNGCDLLLIAGQPTFDWSAIKYAMGWICGFILVGLYEEYLFRGYLQATLTRGIGFWWSALLLSLTFGCSHIFNKGESPVGIFSATLLGMVFCISLWYLKQLWWAIGFHASWNWGQSYFWGTANSGRVVHGHLFSVHPQGNILLSGGATGPEGSLLVVPLLLLIAFVMWIFWRRTNTRLINNVRTTTSSSG